MKVVALGSSNPSKIQAAEMACKVLFREYKLCPVTIEATSKQPLSEIEIIRGAIYRATSAIKKVPDADYGLGLEGGLRRNDYGVFVTGWVAVVDKFNNLGLASTVAVQLPDYVWELVEKRKVCELEEIMARLSGIPNIGDTIGAIGFMTLERYTRADAFRDAIICAFGRILRREIFEKALNSVVV